MITAKSPSWASPEMDYRWSNQIFQFIIEKSINELVTVSIKLFLNGSTHLAYLFIFTNLS